MKFARATAVLLLSSPGCVARRPPDAGAGIQSASDPNDWRAENHDADADGDGLSDFEETHKYLTDPLKADSDGDGRHDGDWDERREFTYTVRNRLEVLRPFSLSAMQTDQQDARLTEDRGASALFDVVYYPFNTAAKAIQPNDDWRSPSPALASYLKPGVTSNWDEALAKDLRAALAALGVDAAQLSDVDLVTKVTDWEMGFKGQAPFVAYVTDVSNGTARLASGMRPVFEIDNHGISDAELAPYLAAGVFGKTIYENRGKGSCTPTAILTTTLLRALGIPTRIVVTVPPIDPNDDAQKAFLAGIRNPTVRATLNEALIALRGWVAHTFNEVYVGGRWTKLNYNTLGQNVLDAQYFGLLTHVNTLRDWTDAPYVETWGRRLLDDIEGHRSPALSSYNHYRSFGLSDELGAHCKVPEILASFKATPIPGHVAAAFKASTFGASGPQTAAVNRLHWSTDADLPAWTKDFDPAIFDAGGASRMILAFVNDPSGASAGYKVYSTFSNTASGSYALVSGDGGPIPIELMPGSLTNAASSEGTFRFRVPAPSAAALVPGKAYRIDARPDNPDRAWFFPADLFLAADRRVD